MYNDNVTDDAGKYDGEEGRAVMQDWVEEGTLFGGIYSDQDSTDRVQSPAEEEEAEEEEAEEGDEEEEDVDEEEVWKKASAEMRASSSNRVVKKGCKGSPAYVKAVKKRERETKEYMMLRDACAKSGIPLPPLRKSRTDPDFPLPEIFMSNCQYWGKRRAQERERLFYHLCLRIDLYKKYLVCNMPDKELPAEPQHAASEKQAMKLLRKYCDTLRDASGLVVAMD